MSAVPAQPDSVIGADAGVIATGVDPVAVGRMQVAGDVVMGDKNVYRTGRPKVSWPVRIGQVPDVTAQFQYRPGVDLAARFATADQGAGTVTLMLAGLGGTGKTQLAAQYARTLTDRVDLRVWVSATSRAGVVTGYAAAATKVGLAGASRGDEQAAAEAFLSWLERTKKSWLIVVDDLADPADLDGLWPSGRLGQMVVTTRRRDAELADHGDLVDVGVFDPEQADAYLTARLATWQCDDVAGVAADLGLLPLAVAQAASYMLHRGGGGLRCTQYRARLADRAKTLDVVLPSDARAGGNGGKDTVRATVATTWSLSIDAANALPPPGAARVVLAVASLLDANGIPIELFNTASIVRAARRLSADQCGLSGEDLVDALDHLARFSLADLNTDSRGQRWLRVHALVQRAVREEMRDDATEAIAWIVADAIQELWPPEDHRAEVAEYLERLRGNVAALRDVAPVGLFHQDAEGAHPVLFAAVRSLGAQPHQAVDQAHTLAMDCERFLGPDHPDTWAGRNALAQSYLQAGRLIEAQDLFKTIVTARARLLGLEHPKTLNSLLNLGRAYLALGRFNKALPLLEAAMTGFEQVPEAERGGFLASRLELAQAYFLVGRLDEALHLFEASRDDFERMLGPEHPDTLTGRNNLALAYQEAGRLSEAVPLFETTLIDRERMLGAQHPSTLSSLLNLARAYQAVGRFREAVRLFELSTNGFERVLGPDHLDTLASRNNLAIAYHKAGRQAEAVSMFEATLADSERVLGPGHPDSLAARENLARAYRAAGRHADASSLTGSSGTS